MNDLIDRQAAIEALFELYEYQRDIDPTEAADLVRQGIYLAEKKIERLPSAQSDVPDTNVGDMISRQAAIDFIDAGHLCNPNEPRWSDNEVVNFLKSRPSVQPERKKARWITTPYPGDDRLTNYKCPLCTTGFSYVKCTQARPNFCMNCGADMRCGNTE